MHTDCPSRTFESYCGRNNNHCYDRASAILRRGCLLVGTPLVCKHRPVFIHTDAKHHKAHVCLDSGIQTSAEFLWPEKLNCLPFLTYKINSSTAAPHKYVPFLVAEFGMGISERVRSYKQAAWPYPQHYARDASAPRLKKGSVKISNTLPTPSPPPHEGKLKGVHRTTLKFKSWSEEFTNTMPEINQKTNVYIYMYIYIYIWHLL